MRLPLRALALPFLCLAGCLPPESHSLLVNENPFGGQPVTPPPSRAPFPAPSTESAARVDTLGRAILAANPQVGVKPLFRTIGTPDAEVFHRATAEIDITEGLVRQCRTDGQLAAILCLELGKMVSERTALAAPIHRAQERELPPDLRVANDLGSDMTRDAELAKYYDPARRRNAAAALPPDPQALARTYLTKSGFEAISLEGVEPLLRAAAANSKFEKQIAAPGPNRPWTQAQ
ncbi:hypothetical protein AYO44_01145 [Planctomycetaceae bacterium SCGC AG-212-F19]|nr:hypothetical protein AYO44_01145 [Planctomycetaceae bacterium SCGC AG-212-F19]